MSQVIEAEGASQAPGKRRCFSAIKSASQAHEFRMLYSYFDPREPTWGHVVLLPALPTRFRSPWNQRRHQVHHRFISRPAVLGLGRGETRWEGEETHAKQVPFHTASSSVQLPTQACICTVDRGPNARSKVSYSWNSRS